MKPYTIIEGVGFVFLIISLYSLLSGRVMISLAFMFAGYTILGINMMIRNVVKELKKIYSLECFNDNCNRFSESEGRII